MGQLSESHSKADLLYIYIDSSKLTPLHKFPTQFKILLVVNPKNGLKTFCWVANGFTLNTLRIFVQTYTLRQVAHALQPCPKTVMVVKISKPFVLLTQSYSNSIQWSITSE